MTVRHEGAERRPRWSPNCSYAAQKMRVGPSGSACRSRSQTALELLGSKAPVVSVQGKGATGSHQVRTRKTNESEPPLKCRKRRDVIESRPQSLACDKAWGIPVYCPSGGRHERRREPGLGFCAERGNLSPRCEGRTPSGRPTRSRVPMRGTGADRPVRAMKPGNAGRAKVVGPSGDGRRSTSNGRSL
jgi:hypothetical protein